MGLACSAAGLASGQYTVKFGTFDGVYESEWWDNKTSRENADPVTVIDGQTTGGKNAELAVRAIQAGKIAGTVTGPSATVRPRRTQGRNG